MPRIFRTLGFIVYFWSNEGNPMEPLHVHVAKTPCKNGTKFWVLSDGRIELESNGSNLTPKEISRIKCILQSYSDEILIRWESYFGTNAIFKDKI